VGNTGGFRWAEGSGAEVLAKRGYHFRLRWMPDGRPVPPELTAPETAAWPDLTV